MSAEPAASHLKPDEIRYLALEGGGGKGFAYLGAIEVLEKCGVMAHLDGVAGTSAGAITALMLSMGMTSTDIQHELETTDFNTFFDPPRDAKGRRLIPAPFAYMERENDECETQTLAGSLDPRQMISFLMCMRNQPSVMARLFDVYAWELSLAGVVGQHAGNALADKVQSSVAPVAALLRGLPEYLAYFDRDMGFFSGLAARDYFDGLLRKAATKKLGARATQRLPSIPFRLHKELFKRDLLLCGANLSIGKSVLFSWKHTPNFPVADAVRISMSLPLAYKPYVISTKVPGWPPCGTYMDGGIWNNLPFREIGNIRQSTARPKSRSAASTPAPANRDKGTSVAALTSARTTLGLRLQIDPPHKVLTGGDFVGAFVMAGLGAGESQVIADIEPFTLLLDTEGLDLLKFAPDDQTKKTVGPRSRRATYRYFGLPVPAADQDEADDARVDDLKQRDVCD